MKKRLLSILLILSMMVTMIPAMSITALAETIDRTGWTKITDSTTISTNGNYYLDGDITGNITISESATVTLDLNGYVLKGTDSGSVITNSGTLTINDSNTGNQSHNFKVDANGLWTLTEDAKTIDYENLTARPETDAIIAVKGGCITGGTTGSTDQNGGGIYNTGTLTVSGGSIVGNKAGSYGGGIYNTHTLTISGGSIAGNKADSYGGGIYNNCGTLNISSGEIVSNTAQTAGGVYGSANVTINMEGGTISGNNATSGMGGGVNNVGTFKMNDGTITGNSTNQNGGAIYNEGTLTINQGNITGNSANMYGGGILINSEIRTNIQNCEFECNNASNSGGAIFLQSGGANICDCSIHDNSAQKGGGIACNSATEANLSRTAVTNNTAIAKGGGIYANDNGCFAAGTRITMADGTVKNIEDIRDGDRIRTFDHETGELSSEEVQYVYRGEEQYAPFTLHFTNDIDINVVSGHDFLEKSTRKYVVITLANIERYIGKYFYNADADRWEQLLGTTVQTEATDYYTIYSAHHINCVAGGMLNVGYDSAWLLNLFEKDEDLCFDPVEKQSDIEKYGLLAYEDAPYVTPETYDYWNVKYSSIGIGKGLISYDTLVRWCAYGYYYFLASQNTNLPLNTMAADNLPMLLSPAPSQEIPLLQGSEPLNELEQTESPAATLRIGSEVVVKDNVVKDSISETNADTDNVYLTREVYCMLLENAGDSKVGITLEDGIGRFTTNGSDNDTDLFFSDDPDYSVKYNSTGYLELIRESTLYFGQNSTNSVEYSLYTDKAKTKNFYDGYGSTWSVEWSAADNKPQLNLAGFNSNGSRVQIDCDCIINATGTNTMRSENANGLVINQNTVIKGNGTLNVSSGKGDAMTVNAIATVDGATVNCSTENSNKKDISFGDSGKIKLVSGDIKDRNSTSFYPDTLSTLYLAKTANKEYALYTDCETCNFEYAVGACGTEELADSNHYAVLNLSGELTKSVIFKQDAALNYSAVLRVTGTDTKLSSFDVSDGTLTVQSSNGNKIAVSGDIKAQKLYMVQCNGLTMEVDDGSIIASEKEGVINELMIGSDSDANMVKLTIKNGGIRFEKGAITVINSDVNIDKNSAEKAAAVGIFAHRINLDGSKLTVNDVATGIKLYEPEQYGEGAVLTVGNKSTLDINAAEVGVQGTFGEGGNYYNNITVLDTDSTITVAGGMKAVASVAISPVPTGKIVRSTDGRAVFFKINDDVNFTTDYYYGGTTDIATALTLADVTVFIDAAIENGEVTVSDPGASAGSTVTVTAAPNKGYELDAITVKDKNGTDITMTVLSGTTITIPQNNLPITVSTTFKEKPIPLCTYSSPLTSGEHMLLLCGKEAGTFTISGDSCKGFQIKNGDKYVAIVNGVLETDSDTSYTWKYDGGLYTETKTTCKTGFWFWCKPTTKGTKQYLSLKDDQLVLSGCKVCAEVLVMANEHTWAYLHDCDGCHEAVCTKCGYKAGPEKHAYDENTHLCKCGKIDPKECCVSDVEVTEKQIKKTAGFLFRKKQLPLISIPSAPRHRMSVSVRSSIPVTTKTGTPAP